MLVVALSVHPLIRYCYSFPVFLFSVGFQNLVFTTQLGQVNPGLPDHRDESWMQREETKKKIHWKLPPGSWYIVICHENRIVSLVVELTQQGLVVQNQTFPVAIVSNNLLFICLFYIFLCDMSLWSWCAYFSDWIPCTNGILEKRKLNFSIYAHLVNS